MKKRPGTMSDDERATVGRESRRTPRGGVPIPESWDSDHTPPPYELFARIDEKLATLARSATQSETIIEEYIKPQLDHWRATTDVIARDMPRLLAAVEALTLSVGNLDRRLREFEVKTEARAVLTEANHAAIERRIANAEHADRLHSDRLKSIEDKQLIDDATRAVIAKTSRKAGGTFGAIVATIVSALAAAASHLAK